MLGMLKQSDVKLIGRFRRAKEDVRRYLAGETVEMVE